MGSIEWCRELFYTKPIKNFEYEKLMVILYKIVIRISTLKMLMREEGNLIIRTILALMLQP